MRENTILDIGSSKVICLICSTDSKDGIVVKGAGIKEYSGYEQGRFLDEQDFSNAVVDAVDMAETEARVRIRDLAVGVPASFSRLMLHEGYAEVLSRSGRVDAETIDDLISSSLRFKQPEGYTLMHSTPVEFNIAGRVTSESPVGQAVDELSATVSHVYVRNDFKRLMYAALDRVGLEPDMYINVPLSSSLFVIPEEERMDCAILIDVGAKQTDVSLIRGSALICCETLDIGGEHFASDIAFGLKVPLSAAENVKRRYVYSLDYQDSIDIVLLEGRQPMHVEHSVIQFIIEARTQELASIVVDMIKKMGVRLEAQPPIYITGGGVSLMRGSCEYLEKLMGVPLKVRMPWMPRLSSPNYASAFSVVDFMLHADDENSAGRLVGMVAESGLIRKIKDFFDGSR